MILWIIIAVLALASMIGLARLLLRTGGEKAALDPAGAVFRDQLAEIKGEVERGLITPEEARAMEAEIGRRMLQTAKQDSEAETASTLPSQWMSRAGLAAVLCLPLGAVGLYGALGTPGLPDLPLAGRSLETENLARQQGEMSAMASRLEERLAKDPGNRAGWQLLARTYWSGGNFARAAEAFRRAHELAQGNATIAADYAETLVMADKGAFSETARAVFAKALAWNKLEPKSLFYQGLDLAQRGKNAEAMQVWINLINISPPGAPWMATVGGRIQALAKASGIDPASIKPTLTAPKPPPSKTTPPALSGSQMMEIRAMVQRLAERLKKEPNDLEGWRMLARSYRVLGEKQKVAQVEARIKALSGSP